MQEGEEASVTKPRQPWLPPMVGQMGCSWSEGPRVSVAVQEPFVLVMDISGRDSPQSALYRPGSCLSEKTDSRLCSLLNEPEVALSVEGKGGDGRREG